MVGLAVLVAVPVPVLGDPPDADLDNWNTGRTRVTDCRGRSKQVSTLRKNNCYNYATNKKTGTFAQPGRKARGDDRKWRKEFNDAVKKMGGSFKKKSAPLDSARLRKFGALIKKLAVKDGLTFVRGGAAPPRINKGESLVALVVGFVPSDWEEQRRRPDGTIEHIPLEELDYHWFRRNAAINPFFHRRTWSHKPGGTKATTKDDNGQTITCPSSMIRTRGASQYDRMVGWFKFKPADVSVRGGGGSDDFDLVVAPPDSVVVGSMGLSGVVSGWLIDTPGQIDQLVERFLVGLEPISDPGIGVEAGDLGFTLEAEPAVLPALTGAWTPEDEVRITVFNGLVRVQTHADPGDQVRVAWFIDSTGLEESLAQRPIDQIELFPAMGALACDDCYADLNDDGGVDVLDFFAFTEAFDASDPRADCDANGTIDVRDLFCFIEAFADGCG